MLYACAVNHITVGCDYEAAGIHALICRKAANFSSDRTWYATSQAIQLAPRLVHVGRSK